MPVCAVTQFSYCAKSAVDLCTDATTAFSTSGAAVWSATVSTTVSMAWMVAGDTTSTSTASSSEGDIFNASVLACCRFGE